MNTRSRLDWLSHIVHRNFIWLLAGSYLIAAFFPGLGLWMRGVTFGEVSLGQERAHVSLPMVMLALILGNAGLGIRTAELRGLLRAPHVLAGGLAGNLLVPVLFIFIVSRAMGVWHNQDEVQNILVGLALVAAMPIAGSSTAWAQNANGDLALSLGLVLFSTFLSPLTTPVVFDLVEHMASGQYADALEELESNGTGVVLIFCVLLPSLAGMAVQHTAGPARIARWRPGMKLANSINLLLLNYSNAAVSLPQAAVEQDWDFLAMILVIVTGLCTLGFLSGWLIGKLLHGGREQRIALMFALGMNNNGTGLVLASMAVAHFPRVLLPVIFYNLIQHLVAGTVDRFWCRREPASAADGPSQNRQPSRPWAEEARWPEMGSSPGTARAH
jgi:BASS family bile acid:Na+ symporter